MTDVATAATPASVRRRRAAAWVGIGAVLLTAGIGGAVLSGLGQFTQRDTLDPATAGPDGGRALARILADHGVDVQIVRDRSAVASALQAAGGSASRAAEATLVLPDSPYLGGARLRSLAASARDVAVIQPQSRALRELFGAVVSGYGADAPVDPGCAVDAARRAGAVAPGALYRASADLTACYRVGSGAALLQRTSGDVTITAVDGTALFTNATLARHGDAALGVNLLGAHRTLIWYVPSAGDIDPGIVAPTLGDLTPGWVSPVIVLALATGVAAVIWRGRRFGPLVTENLPVTVRAAETTQGRARLYARSRDVGHVAERLRRATRGRIARALGLGAGTAASEISDAAADLLRMPRAEVHGVLVAPDPGTEGGLLALSDRLYDLERAVTTTVRPVAPPGTRDDALTDPGRNRP